MRIVGGVARGRRLVVPSAGTRPTSERAREALFNRLDTLLEVAGARVLDLYAGSGAVGLEALSRGAEQARFVESDRAAAAIIARNAQTVVGSDRGRYAVTTQPVERFVAQGSGPAADPAYDPAYDIVFADPPYAVLGAEIDAVLAAVTTAQWLVPGGVVVVERAARDPEPRWPVWVEPLSPKRYGDSQLWYGRPTEARTP